MSTMWNYFKRMYDAMIAAVRKQTQDKAAQQPPTDKTKA